MGDPGIGSRMRYTLMVLALLTLALLACEQTTPVPATIPPPTPLPTPITRLAAIPPDAVKVTPADDPWPPVVAPGWSKPVPLGTPVNTAGAEDSPFITPDGTWGEPEEIVSTFAAEPTLTLRHGSGQAGDGRTLYFVHHYFTADLSRMLEADIYVTRRMER